MQLTLMTDYALRMLMYLAQHPDERCTIADIAAVHRISEAHLMKVTHRLSQGGWIITSRGRGGGIRLGAAPSAINVGKVVRSMEPGFALVECFSDDSSCLLTGRCQLSAVLEGALQSFLAHLDGCTLADLTVAPATASAAVRRRALPLAGPSSRRR